MRVKLYIPQPTHDLVSDFWDMQFDPGEIPLTQTIPPFGKPELIFYLKQPYQIDEAQVERCLIKGQYTRLQAINLITGAHLFGIRLQPYALHTLFDFDPSRLTDQILDGEPFELMRQICDLLMQKDAIDELLTQDIASLLNNSRKRSASPSTLKFLELSARSKTTIVGEIIEKSGFSIRTLQRNFMKEVGLSPKKYLRLIRVNQIEEMLRSTSDWIEVATRFNLADQSHLIREIRSFRQNNPTTLINRKLLIHNQLPEPEIIPVRIA